MWKLLNEVFHCINIFVYMKATHKRTDCDKWWYYTDINLLYTGHNILITSLVSFVLQALYIILCNCILRLLIAWHNVCITRKSRIKFAPTPQEAFKSRFNKQDEFLNGLYGNCMICMANLISCHFSVMQSVQYMQIISLSNIKAKSRL